MFLQGDFKVLKARLILFYYVLVVSSDFCFPDLIQPTFFYFCRDIITIIFVKGKDYLFCNMKELKMELVRYILYVIAICML